MKVGDTFKTKEGSLVTVVMYENAHNVIIKFPENSEYTKTVSAKNIRNGSVKNPYKRSVLGVGYLGGGEYTSSSEGKRDPAYHHWIKMMYRCYCPNFQQKHPSYVGCYVAESWHNYQNFAQWFYEVSNYRKGLQLDKDILGSGTKSYSKSKCSFVPKEINLLLTGDTASNDLPPGVSRSRQKGKFRSRCSVGKETLCLGTTFLTPKDAFLAYKKAKERWIREVANKFKTALEPRVYKALLTYEVTYV